MRIYKRRVEDFSHNAVVFNLWGDTWIAEALAWGVRIWPVEHSGYLDQKQLIILRHKKGFTQDQIDALSNKVTRLAGTRYQYEGFLQWIPRILLKANTFKPSNEKAIFCSELAAIAINEAHPGTFPKPNQVNPADHVSSDIYEIIDINEIL